MELPISAPRSPLEPPLSVGYLSHLSLMDPKFHVIAAPTSNITTPATTKIQGLPLGV